MARRPYNPNWRTQPRDRQGKWRRVGSALGSGIKKLGGAARAVARTGPFQFGYGANLYKGTVGGSVSTTKKLPGGYAITSRLETRIHPQGKSPFERASESARDAAISKIGNKRAKNVAAFVLERPVKLKSDSGVRVQNGYIRSRSSKEVQGAKLRVERRKARKLRQIEFYRANARSGLPGTITGQGRAQRRGNGAR